MERASDYEFEGWGFESLYPHYAALAQSVERNYGTVKVDSSILSRSSHGTVAQLGERSVEARKADGSTPSRTTIEYLEVCMSGLNGPPAKWCVPKGHEGSNPSTSAVEAEWFDEDLCWISMIAPGEPLDTSYIISFSAHDWYGDRQVMICENIDGVDEPLPMYWTIA